MRGSKFIFDSVDLLHYHHQKISSYVDYPKWIKNKNKTNPKSNDNKCFQYAAMAALNHKQSKNHPQKMCNLKPFINEYDWKELIFLHNKKTGKSLNKVIGQSLLIFYLYHTILKK